jgi:integrase
LTVADAINDFLVAKARQGRSDRYLRQIRVVLVSFAKGRNRRPLVSVHRGDVETWLQSSTWGPRTKANYARDLRSWFAWCGRRGWIEGNPAAGLDLPRVPEAVPSLHTPEQVRTVLEAAKARDRQVMRFLAICYFAGVRSAEAYRLREEDLKGGFVQVSALKSKTRSRRLVRIRPALAAWLNEGGTLGPMSPNRVRAVVRASEVPWSHNVARHSWASYCLASDRDAASVALEAGHTEAILFRHYREQVTPDQAAAFWALRPG